MTPPLPLRERCLLLTSYVEITKVKTLGSLFGYTWIGPEKLVGLQEFREAFRRQSRASGCCRRSSVVEGNEVVVRVFLWLAELSLVSRGRWCLPPSKCKSFVWWGHPTTT